MRDYRDVCFVIMPFGKKDVSIGEVTKKIDFDRIYDELYAPAIAAVGLPASEGDGHLEPVRTDREFHSGVISQDMFELIEYSRYVVADISSINANVYYELGARHRAQESGTAIFRQDGVAIPFDINQVKAFPYLIDPQEKLAEARALVTRVLTESLRRNAWDSPIRLALRGQQSAPQSVQDVLMEAENALRTGDHEAAHERWVKAAELDPGNPVHDIKASMYPKTKGDWAEVIRLMHSALAKEAAIGERAESTYAEAYRELGIAQNKAEAKVFPGAGEESLRRAVMLAPEDFDAWASLGGVRRRAANDAGALEAYEKAVEVSEGHPYPLLMALKLRAKVSGRWQLEGEARDMLIGARGFRGAQVANDPPMDAPWSLFDLAEINLYLGKNAEALTIARKALDASTAPWMPGTFLSALENLPETAELGALSELKQLARARRKALEAEQEAEQGE